jgi:hypothetical protein
MEGVRGSNPLSSTKVVSQDIPDARSRGFGGWHLRPVGRVTSG